MTVVCSSAAMAWPRLHSWCSRPSTDDATSSWQRCSWRWAALERPLLEPPPRRVRWPGSNTQSKYFIGGEPAPILCQGLALSTTGLYQLNVRILTERQSGQCGAARPFDHRRLQQPSDFRDQVERAQHPPKSSRSVQIGAIFTAFFIDATYEVMSLESERHPWN
jgi:hypothetical protein